MPGHDYEETSSMDVDDRTSTEDKCLPDEVMARELASLNAAMPDCDMTSGSLCTVCTTQNYEAPKYIPAYNSVMRGTLSTVDE